MLFFICILLHKIACVQLNEFSIYDNLNTIIIIVIISIRNVHFISYYIFVLCLFESCFCSSTNEILFTRIPSMFHIYIIFKVNIRQLKKMYVIIINHQFDTSLKDLFSYNPENLYK